MIRHPARAEHLELAGRLPNAIEPFPGDVSGRGLEADAQPPAERIRGRRAFDQSCACLTDVDAAKAASRSSTRSSALSIPTESLTSAGDTASGVSSTDWCVIPAGTSINDSTAPSDSASVKRRVAAANPRELAQLAWHIGNRHTEIEIAGERLRIRRDSVLEEMLRGLGAQLSPVEAPFEPEPGAYGQEHRHDHPDHES